jgi:surfeit locus 1 family protein
VTPRSPLRAWLSPGLIGLHVLGVVAVVFCLVMGLWQMGAYDSRQEHERADQQAVPTVALTDLWNPDEPFSSTLSHRPVSFEGQFVSTGDQVWITDKEQDGRTGAWLLAPLEVEGGETMLVVRGWAPETGPFPEVPKGTVSLDAVLQPGEAHAGTFDASARSIGSVRIPSLINEMPYDLYSGFAISTDEASSGGLELVPPPQPGDVPWTVGLRNLAYALQWWVFGLFAAFMWWRMCTETLAVRREKVA